MTRKALLLLVLLFAAPFAIAQGTLTVGFTGTHSSMGSYLDITAVQATSITAFQMNLATGPVAVSVYTKSGTTAGFENNSAAWALYTTVNVTGNGQGVATNVVIPPYAMNAGQTRAFYLLTDANGKIFNADGPVTSASNAVLSLSSAYESHGSFASTYNGWGFQGAVVYGAAVAPVAPPADIPTLSEWGLIALMLMTGLVAAGNLRRRRK